MTKATNQPRNQHVKPFSSLTRLGKARRLRSGAHAALASFGIDADRLQLLATATNTLYRVRSGTGELFALRCCAPGWRTDTDLRSEAMWLEALGHDTDIGAPMPIRTPDGDIIVCVNVEGVAKVTCWTLMIWIPGIVLGKRLSVDILTKMGALFARIHAHGATFRPPDGFTSRRMNTYLARDEADVLFCPKCLGSLPQEQQDLLALTRAAVDDAFVVRYADPAGLRVIHNDLWHDNLKLHRGKLRPFDFEDTLWGYPVQDIAMAWLDLPEAVTPDAYGPYTDAFRTGYERHASWPEAYPGEIDLFQTGRRLWVANYVAAYQPQHLTPHIAWLAPRLKEFLTSGRVRAT